MKNFASFLIVCLFIVSSCQSEPVLSPEIGAAELAYEKEQSPDNTKKLIELYTAYLNENPSSDKRAECHYKLGELQSNANRFAAAIEQFQQVLKSDYGSTFSPEAAIALGELYAEKLNNPKGASAVYQCFVEAFPTHPKAEEIKGKIANDAMSIDDMMKDLGASIYNDKTNRIDFKVANDFVGMAEIHALMLPKSEKTASYLHDAGRTAGYQRSFPKAIKLYEWVITQYPNHEQAANSTFMLGYTHDNDMKDYEKAKTYYQQFLDKYPDNDLAASAQVLLDNLGVPDDKIIEKLQSK